MFYYEVPTPSIGPAVTQLDSTNRRTGSGQFHAISRCDARIGPIGVYHLVPMGPSGQAVCSSR